MPYYAGRLNRLAERLSEDGSLKGAFIAIVALTRSFPLVPFGCSEPGDLPWWLMDPPAIWRGDMGAGVA
jgi:hypothetical protein